MAAIKAVVTDVSEMGDGATLRVVWTPVTEADECVPVRLPWLADRTIQALGTFGSCNVAVHGSNDGGVTYAALNDPTGTVIDITAAGIKQVLENTEWTKPVVTTGSSQSISIAMLFHASNPKRT